MRKSLRFGFGGAALAGLVLAATAPAWWVKGHETITEAAVLRLPDDVPAFFRAGGKQIAHCAGDPDRWKNRGVTFLRYAEEPNHFLDLEELDGQPPADGRFRGIAQMTALRKQPYKVGLLPYAIMEGYEKLACAFADYRRDPDNPAVTMKCLVYAGNLAHYTTDAAMPLHTTRNYDGRPSPDGKMTQKGIHAKLDGFPEKNRFTPEEICRGLQAKLIDDVWAHVQAFIQESHKHIARSYELDAAGGFDNPTDDSRAFVMERCRAGAQFTLDIFYAAWRKSATLPPPY